MIINQTQALPTEADLEIAQHNGNAFARFASVFESSPDGDAGPLSRWRGRSRSNPQVARGRELVLANVTELDRCLESLGSRDPKLKKQLTGRRKKLTDAIEAIERVAEWAESEQRYIPKTDVPEVLAWADALTAVATAEHAFATAKSAEVLAKRDAVIVAKAAEREAHASVDALIVAAKFPDLDPPAAYQRARDQARRIRSAAEVGARQPARGLELACIVGAENDSLTARLMRCFATEPATVTIGDVTVDLWAVADARASEPSDDRELKTDRARDGAKVEFLQTLIG